jgi:hypothetical protein
MRKLAVPLAALAVVALALVAYLSFRGGPVHEDRIVRIEAALDGTRCAARMEDQGDKRFTFHGVAGAGNRPAVIYQVAPPADNKCSRGRLRIRDIKLIDNQPCATAPAGGDDFDVETDAPTRTVRLRPKGRPETDDGLRRTYCYVLELVVDPPDGSTETYQVDPEIEIIWKRAGP